MLFPPKWMGWLTGIHLLFVARAFGIDSQPARIPPATTQSATPMMPYAQDAVPLKPAAPPTMTWIPARPTNQAQQPSVKRLPAWNRIMPKVPRTNGIQQPKTLPRLVPAPMKTGKPGAIPRPQTKPNLSTNKPMVSTEFAVSPYSHFPAQRMGNSVRYPHDPTPYPLLSGGATPYAVYRTPTRVVTDSRTVSPSLQPLPTSSRQPLVRTSRTTPKQPTVAREVNPRPGHIIANYPGPLVPTTLPANWLHEQPDQGANKDKASSPSTTKTVSSKPYVSTGTIFFTEETATAPTGAAIDPEQLKQKILALGGTATQEVSVSRDVLHRVQVHVKMRTQVEAEKMTVKILELPELLSPEVHLNVQVEP